MNINNFKQNFCKIYKAGSLIATVEKTKIQILTIQHCIQIVKCHNTYTLYTQLLCEEAKQ